MKTRYTQLIESIRKKEWHDANHLFSSIMDQKVAVRLAEEKQRVGLLGEDEYARDDDGQFASTDSSGSGKAKPLSSRGVKSFFGSIFGKDKGADVHKVWKGNQELKKNLPTKTIIPDAKKQKAMSQDWDDQMARAKKQQAVNDEIRARESAARARK